MDQKQNKKTASAAPKEAPKPANNRALWWILGGCLALFVLVALSVGGLMYWGYKKINQAASENRRQIEERQKDMTANKAASQNAGGPASMPGETSAQPAPQAISEEPPENPNSPPAADGALPFAGERQIGYVKKVYTKSGKNYINIDYIQWLTGAEAEKAMREDGECPKKGECIVYDDYYIRNINPLVRPFEISSEAEITMQTFAMESTGQIQPQKISFDQFSQLFSTGAEPRFKNVPYIIEISSNKIAKINEQYIP